MPEHTWVVIVVIIIVTTFQIILSFSPLSFLYYYEYFICLMLYMGAGLAQAV
jgi:hypothetical protein